MLRTVQKTGQKTSTPTAGPSRRLHGDKDTDVPYEQSVLMAEKPASAGGKHELITIPGGGHGFDRRYPEPVVVQAFDRRWRSCDKTWDSFFFIKAEFYGHRAVNRGRAFRQLS